MTWGTPTGYRRALAEIQGRHGRIDILVNNAGVDLILRVPGGEEATVREVFDVNFFATVAGTLAVLPAMAERRSGVVVNVSSDTARAPEPGQGAYAASKAAVAAFTESVAHEMATFGVHVHVLYPGWVPTAMGLPGNDDPGSLPPKMVRRTADGVAALVAERMGDPRIEINAAWLPLLAPIMRSIAPGPTRRPCTARRRPARRRSRTVLPHGTRPHPAAGGGNSPGHSSSFDPRDPLVRTRPRTVVGPVVTGEP